MAMRCVLYCYLYWPDEHLAPLAVVHRDGVAVVEDEDGGAGAVPDDELWKKMEEEKNQVVARREKTEQNFDDVVIIVYNFPLQKEFLFTKLNT